MVVLTKRKKVSNVRANYKTKTKTKTNVKSKSRKYTKKYMKGGSSFRAKSKSKGKPQKYSGPPLNIHELHPSKLLPDSDVKALRRHVDKELKIRSELADAGVLNTGMPVAFGSTSRTQNTMGKTNGTTIRTGESPFGAFRIVTRNNPGKVSFPTKKSPAGVFAKTPPDAPVIIETTLAKAGPPILPQEGLPNLSQIVASHASIKPANTNLQKYPGLSVGPPNPAILQMPESSFESPLFGNKGVLKKIEQLPFRVKAAPGNKIGNAAMILNVVSPNVRPAIAVPGPKTVVTSRENGVPRPETEVTRAANAVPGPKTVVTEAVKEGTEPKNVGPGSANVGTRSARKQFQRLFKAVIKDKGGKEGEGVSSPSSTRVGTGEGQQPYYLLVDSHSKAPGVDNPIYRLPKPTAVTDTGNIYGNNKNTGYQPGDYVFPSEGKNPGVKGVYNPLYQALTADTSSHTYENLMRNTSGHTYTNYPRSMISGNEYGIIPPLLPTQSGRQNISSFNPKPLLEFGQKPPLNLNRNKAGVYLNVTTTNGPDQNYLEIFSNNPGISNAYLNVKKRKNAPVIYVEPEAENPYHVLSDKNRISGKNKMTELEIALQKKGDYLNREQRQYAEGIYSLPANSNKPPSPPPSANLNRLGSIVRKKKAKELAAKELAENEAKARNAARREMNADIFEPRSVSFNKIN